MEHGSLDNKMKKALLTDSQLQIYFLKGLNTNIFSYLCLEVDKVKMPRVMQIWGRDFWIRGKKKNTLKSKVEKRYLILVQEIRKTNYFKCKISLFSLISFLGFTTTYIHQKTDTRFIYKYEKITSTQNALNSLLPMNAPK